MFARVTLFEIDPLRVNVDEALEHFQDRVVPEMHRQPGYEGAYLMKTPEGKGLLLTLWATEDTAAAGITSGYYDEQIAKFVAIFRAPPGRDHYEVMFAEPATSGVAPMPAAS